ncbi:MAG TPA: AmmeMemoRadiSam system protein A [Thiotrichales bacterium]|nr:AmmeMemoRadiSam system protein A [Thiotrichales bacterium]
MLNRTQREQLSETAWASIRHGLRHGQPLAVNMRGTDPVLAAPGAAFVTLHKLGQLRGCIGSLEAWRPLIEDVAENAFAAAFRDPRFPPLGAAELPDLDLEISVLGKPEPLSFTSEQDLLHQLRPGVDGLILAADGRRGTFLPAVWKSLPEPERFLSELKRKAGLPADYWSDDVEVWRYSTESFNGPRPEA